MELEESKGGYEENESYDQLLNMEDNYDFGAKQKSNHRPIKNPQSRLTSQRYASRGSGYSRSSRDKDKSLDESSGSLGGSPGYSLISYRHRVGSIESSRGSLAKLKSKTKPK